MSRTLAEFFAERADYLRVSVMPSESGTGWDIVLRLDGTHTNLRAAVDACAGIRDHLERLSDWPVKRLVWWNGPPWIEPYKAWWQQRIPRGRRIPAELRAAVIARDGLICGICGGEVAEHEVHIDHLQPVALGGLTILSNLRVTHAGCNASRGAEAL